MRIYPESVGLSAGFLSYGFAEALDDPPSELSPESTRSDGPVTELFDGSYQLASPGDVSVCF
jgi:hypothetical protein